MHPPSSVDAERKLGRAKAALVIEQPFIASIICGMPLIVDDTIVPPTLCTNGQYVKAHPAWIAAHTPAELRWALGHETLHCVFQHFLKSRIGPRDFTRWNIAGDVVINALLETDRVGTRPAGVIWEPELYQRGRTTEGVYALLPEDPQAGGGEPGEGQWDSCETMQGDAAQQAEAAASWNVKVGQAAAAAKMCGKLSADMERFVGEATRPRVVWQEQLRHFFTKRARTDHSFARPNRRFMSQGLYLAGRSGHQLGDIAIAVDLSGSIDADELNEFVAEMRAIKEDCMPATVHVIYFDSKVSHYESFTSDEEMVLHPKGGGGTAFSPIFRYIDAKEIEPEACVVLTDLCCSDFGPQPGYPVMWCSTHERRAPWGEVIMLRDKRS